MLHHHTPSNGTCYVLGCGDAPVLCANHKLHGVVATCSSHNPIRHAYDRPLPAMPAPPAPEPPPTKRDDRRRGGPKVRLTPPPTPPRPPAAAVAPF